jgi:hypothetical protein
VSNESAMRDRFDRWERVWHEPLENGARGNRSRRWRTGKADPGSYCEGHPDVSARDFLELAEKSG